MFATNVTGLIAMTQAVLPIFKKRSDGGRGDIINIGSIAGREPYPGGSIYCSTKAAVKSFTEALRKELISTRIRIIEIDPGQVETVSDKEISVNIKADNPPGILRRSLLRRQVKGGRCLCVSHLIPSY
jgi:3-hydroxy acid dehydrogenase/malonic semialdehyde reductase